MTWLRQLSWWGILLAIFCSCNSSKPSLSGIIDVDHYLKMESAMISKGRIYLSQEEERLKLLKTYLKEWKKWRKSYSYQESEYTTIPQNIFHLFKKLVMDLDQIEKTMMTNSYNSTMIPDDFEPPTKDHLKQVVLSLIDLQDLYDLKPNEIMNGELMGLQLNTSLTMDSIHFIGKTCLEYNKHLCACDWLNLWLSESPDDPDRRKEVFGSLYPSYLFLDKKDEAHNYVTKYLEEDPDDVAATDAALELGFTQEKLGNPDLEHLEANRLCRGDFDSKAHTIRSNLKCRYKHGYSAFLKIAPLKEEELSDTPKILLYREVVFDSEIEKIKANNIKNLETARVGPNLKAFKYRISSVAYFDQRSPEFSMLYKRVENICDLSIRLGEEWQLLSYSPGGHYSVHTDFLSSTIKALNIHEYRLATMLFYFNEVILGGETIFTRIRLSVKPIKGAAIIWYSVYGDGSKNSMTNHSACPVIIGEKWGFIQWIWSKNQMCLRRIFDHDSTPSSESIKILRTSIREIERKMKI